MSLYSQKANIKDKLRRLGKAKADLIPSEVDMISIRVKDAAHFSDIDGWRGPRYIEFMEIATEMKKNEKAYHKQAFTDFRGNINRKIASLEKDLFKVNIEIKKKENE